MLKYAPNLFCWLKHDTQTLLGRLCRQVCAEWDKREFNFSISDVINLQFILTILPISLNFLVFHLKALYGVFNWL